MYSLDFLENKAAIKLETKIAAVKPAEEEPLLRGVVLDLQRDRSRSQVAIREEPSIWDDEAGRVRLQHKEADFHKHIRTTCSATWRPTPPSSVAPSQRIG